MSKTTKIQWADATFNPWIGCTKVSPGCANCYAENTTRARVLRGQGHETWGKGKARSRTSAATWKQPLRWNRQQADMDRQWRKGNFNPQERLRVFPSLCDWLDDEVPIEWLADFLKLIHDTPNLDWLLLTKRPENFGIRMLEALAWADQNTSGTLEAAAYFIRGWRYGCPPKNVWFGVSVEDQKRADERIPQLLAIPARIRFLSVEPLLGPIDLQYPKSLWPDGPAMCCNGDECGCRGMPVEPPMLYGIDWVIVGGESGKNARPCDTAWLRDIVRQCKKASVPCFVKQLGARPVEDIADARGHDLGFQRFGDVKHPKGGDQAEWPEDLRVREFPNPKAAIA